MRVAPLKAGHSNRIECGNNPVNGVDPLGLDCNVNVQGNNVNIILPIEFRGSGATPDTIMKFKSDIEKVWTRQVGKYNVTTTVISVDSTYTGKKNTVLIYSKNLDGQSYSSFSEGAWYSARAGYKTSPAPHEAGHLMGLGDLYDNNYQPLPGSEHNVMAGAPRTDVIEAQIEEIIRENP